MSEVIWFGSNANLDRLAVTDVTICLDQATIHPSDCVRNLGVLLDSSLSMRQHIAKIASTCFFHLRRLRKLRRVLDLESQKRLVCAFILTRIDYCNAVLATCTCSTAACASCGSPFCSCHWTSRPHHVDTHLVALVTSPSTNHLQTVHHDAFSVLRSGSIVYIWDCYSSHTWWNTGRAVESIWRSRRQIDARHMQKDMAGQTVATWVDKSNICATSKGWGS